MSRLVVQHPHLTDVTVQLFEAAIGAPAALRVHDRPGLDRAPAGQRHRPPALQLSPELPLGHPGLAGPVRVEAPRARVLLQDPAHRGDAVPRGPGKERGPVAPDGVARVHLVDADLEGHGVGAAQQQLLEEGPRRRRAVHVERPAAPQHGEGPHEADGADVVVGVKMGEADGGDVEPGAVPDHLSLRALAAVEEVVLPPVAHREPRQVPVRGGHGTGGAEEGEAEHGPRVAGGRAAFPSFATRSGSRGPQHSRPRCAGAGGRASWPARAGTWRRPPPGVPPCRARSPR